MPEIRHVPNIKIIVVVLHRHNIAGVHLIANSLPVFADEVQEQGFDYDNDDVIESSGRRS